LGNEKLNITAVVGFTSKKFLEKFLLKKTVTNLISGKDVLAGKVLLNNINKFLSE
jgi:hypothetical protein